MIKQMKMRLLVILISLNLLNCNINSVEKNHTIYMGFAYNPFEFSSVIGSATKKFTRRKRSVIQLYNMVSCATGCNPLSYKGYGCYCGLWGSGVPVDDIDRCCAQHDACYGASSCMFPFYYIWLYYWECIDGVPECINGNGGRTCSDDLCECDQKLSVCLKESSCPRSKPLCHSGWTW